MKRTFVSALVAGVVFIPFFSIVQAIGMQSNTKQMSSEPITLQNDLDKLSYSMGVETGKAFKSHNISMNVDAFTQGLKDGINGNKTLLTEDEMQKKLQDFQQNTVAKLQEQMKQEGQQNKQAQSAFLSSNAKNPNVHKTNSGLQYKILTAGMGATPTDQDTVTVDYEGHFLNGKIFDSSYQRGEPATFPVSAVIPGWQEALKLMKAGSTWELFIPSELAYGEDGAPGTIGPNEMLIFKVHLISVKNSTGAAGNLSQVAK